MLWGSVEGLPGSPASLAGMLADQRVRGGFSQVAGAGPGDAEHRRDHAQVGEVGSGVLVPVRMAVLKHGEHPPLEGKCFGHDASGFWGGLIESLPAGLFLASP